MGIGGTTKDTSVANLAVLSAKAFLIYVSQSTGVVQWAKQISGSPNPSTISALKFSKPTSNYVAATINSNTVMILTFLLSNGNLFSAQQAAYHGKVTTQSILFLNTDQYFAMQGADGKWSLLYIIIDPNPAMSFVWMLELGSSPGSANVIETNSLYTPLFVGGYATIGAYSYDVLSLIDPVTGTQIASYTTNYYSLAQIMQTKMLSVYYDGTNNCVLTGSDGTLNFKSTFSFTLFTFLASTNAFISQEGYSLSITRDVLKLMGLYYYPSSVSFCLWFQNRNEFIFGSLALGATSATLTDYISMDQDSRNTINQVYMTNGYGYFVGATYEVQYPTTPFTFSVSAGYVMSTYSYSCCFQSITQSFTQTVLPITKPFINQALSYNVITSYVEQPLGLGASALTATPFSDTTAWCPQVTGVTLGDPSPLIPNQMYWLYSSPLTVSAAFVPSYACNDMSVSCSVTQCGSAATWSFASSSSSSGSTCIVSISSVTLSDVGGPFCIESKAVLKNSNSKTTTFQLTISNPCLLPPTSFSTPVNPSDFTYYTSQPAVTTILSSFTSSYPGSYCGTIGTSLLINGVTYGTYPCFSFDGTNLILSSTSTNDIGVYTVSYAGLVNGYYSTYYSFTITVYNGVCSSSDFSNFQLSTLFKSTYSYNYKSQVPPFTIPFPSILTMLNCIPSWSFSIADASTGLSIPFLSLSDTTISVDASLQSSIGTTSVKITALLDSIYTYTTTFAIEVIQGPGVYPAPTFNPVLKDQLLYLYESISYTLPSYNSNPSGHSVTLSLPSTSLPVFVTWSNQYKTFYLAPTSTVSLGVYKIDIKLTDQSTSASETYSFSVTVLEQEVVSNDTVDSKYHINTTETNSYASKRIQAKVSSNVNKYISLVIASISSTGLIEVTFSPDLKVPEEYLKFGQETLNIKSINPTTLSPKQFVKSWSIVNFTSSYMYLQMAWSKPTEISASGVIPFIYLFRTKTSSKLKSFLMVTSKTF